MLTKLPNLAIQAVKCRKIASKIALIPASAIVFHRKEHPGLKVIPPDQAKNVRVPQFSKKCRRSTTIAYGYEGIST